MVFLTASEGEHLMPRMSVKHFTRIYESGSSRQSSLVSCIAVIPIGFIENCMLMMDVRICSNQIS